MIYSCQILVIGSLLLQCCALVALHKDVLSAVVILRLCAIAINATRVTKQTELYCNKSDDRMGEKERDRKRKSRRKRSRSKFLQTKDQNTIKEKKERNKGRKKKNYARRRDENLMVIKVINGNE